MNHRDRLYVDFHILQTVPPSCLNRDDTGSPKTAVYGGTTRARVSSQAWKRAMRQMFGEIFDAEQLGQRTKRVQEMIEEVIAAKDASLKEKEVKKLAETALKNAGITVKKEGKTDTLFFMSRKQADALAELALAGEKQAEAYKTAVRDKPSVDIALFGRMVASDASLNYDAAAQVAHSISTHAVQTEYDYFTAVDDRAPEEESGAGHLGTIEFHAATLYRYATVNVRELQQWLGGETAEAVRGFAEAMICAMPNGKQNTFANRTLPDAVYVTVRRDQPINLSGAFERAVPAGAGGYAEQSAERLCCQAQRVYRDFAERPAQAFIIGDALGALAADDPQTQTGSLRQMLDWLGEAIQAGGQA